MQTTLLGLAIAIILALVAALVAPLVINWSHFRTVFEEEASRLTGLAVHVNGSIDARILPTPHIKLHDVAVGEPGELPLLQAAFVDLDVELGPLLRGEMQATELRIVAPQISIGFDGSGAINWPALSPSLRSDAFTISRFDIEDGRVMFADAASGALVRLDKLAFDGDIRSFVGPFRGEGGFVVGDEPYRYRISGGRFDEDTGLKIKFGIEPTNHPLTTDLDGTLSFNSGSPQFDGTLSVARPVGMTLADGERVMSDPWQLAGKVRATAASASLSDLALQYGPDERAVNFTGKAELTFGAHPRLDGTVAAVDMDVDRILAAPDVTHRPPLILLKNFLETFVHAVRPPLPVAVGVAIDAVTVGSAAIQAVEGKVGFDGKAWSIERLAFRAPGFTDVKLNGRLGAASEQPGFAGPVSVESTDVKSLAAWLEGRAEQAPGPAQSLTARGDITFAGDRLALDGLSATLGHERMEGRLAYSWAAVGHPAALDGELRAANLNVDALVAFAKAAASDGAFEIPRKVALVLDVDKATAAGVDVRRVDARFKIDSGIMHVDRLSIGDLGGAAINASGRIDQLSSRPTGRLTLDIDATTLEGLTGVAGKFVPQIAPPLKLFVERLAPVKMHGVLTVERAAAAATFAKLALSGGLGALRLTLNGEVNGEPARLGAAGVRITSRFDADDGGALVQLLALDRMIAVDQLPGQLTISLAGPLDGDVQITGIASAGGFSAAAQGTLHLAGEQASSGSLQLKASAANLRPLQRAMTGEAGTAAAVAATAIIGVAGADLSVTDLVVTAGKSSMRGRLDLRLGNPVGIAGELTATDADAATAAMLLGLPSAAAGAGKAWGSAPIGAGAFAALDGDVAFKFDRVALAAAWVARDLKGVVHFQQPEIALRDLDGSLGGGRLTGELNFRRDAEKLAGQGHIELFNANAGSLLVGGKNAIDGSVTVKLQGESAGLSPGAIIGALHGNGSIVLTNGHFAGIDSTVFDAAIRAADQSGSLELTKQIGPLVSALMDKGRLGIPQGKAEVTMTGGQIRLANATLQAQGGADLALDGVLDLNTASIDARMVLSEQPPADALISARPELAVTLKGPLAAPERRVDMSALLSWLTLRATEQQTRRLESIEANSRTDVLGPAIRPPPSFNRLVPQGTVLETSNKPGAAAPPADPHAFDRLRPESPVAPANGNEHATRPTPGVDKTTAATGAPATAPQPAVHSPLNLLFHSHN